MTEFKYSQWIQTHHQFSTNIQNNILYLKSNSEKKHKSILYLGSGWKNGGPGGGNPANCGGKRAPGNIYTYKHSIHATAAASYIISDISKFTLSPFYKLPPQLPGA